MGLVLVGVVDRAEETEATAAAELEDAPKRCCNNSAILIVVLSIADLGK